MSSIPLSPEKEKEAQQLAARVHEAIEDELLQMARTLVGKDTSDLFGKTEFDLRDIVHRIGAKMYEVHLAEKKTAMSVAVSSVPIANRRRTSKAIAPKPR
jgi:hypothetical protein